MDSRILVLHILRYLGLLNRSCQPVLLHIKPYRCISDSSCQYKRQEHRRTDHCDLRSFSHPGCIPIPCSHFSAMIRRRLLLFRNTVCDHRDTAIFTEPSSIRDLMPAITTKHLFLPPFSPKKFLSRNLPRSLPHRLLPIVLLILRQPPLPASSARYGIHAL